MPQTAATAANAPELDPLARENWAVKGQQPSTAPTSKPQKSIHLSHCEHSTQLPKACKTPPARQEKRESRFCVEAPLYTTNAATHLMPE